MMTDLAWSRIGDGQHLHDVTVRIVEIHGAPPTPRVDFAIPVWLVWLGVVVETSLNDAIGDLIELGIADLERVVVRGNVGDAPISEVDIGEVQRQRLADMQ